MKVKLQNVRLSFPDLFEPRPFKTGDEPKYKATFLVEKESPQAKEIEKAIIAVANEKWPGKGAAIIKNIRGNPNKFNFQDGDNKEYDGYAGMMAFTASSKSRPLVIDRTGVTSDAAKEPNAYYTAPNKNGVMFRVLTKDDGRPYAGCYVNASFDIFGYDNSGNGISATLTGVQFVKDGDAFGGGRPASADEFDDLGEGSGADDLG